MAALRQLAIVMPFSGHMGSPEHGGKPCSTR